MYQVTRKIPFCYGHRLLNYAGKCKNLHGHNGTAVITLEAAELDPLGMVTDFSDIKRIVSTWIDENLDHRLLLNQNDPLIPILKDHNEPLFLMKENPTAENIARLVFDYVHDAGFPVTEVTLWETESCFATYKLPASQSRRNNLEKEVAATR